MHSNARVNYPRVEAKLYLLADFYSREEKEIVSK